MSRFVRFAMVATLLCCPAFAGELFTKQKGETPRLEPTDEHAVVYVFRPAMLGAAVKTWAFVGDELIGVSKARAYSMSHVTPGRHTFWSKAENTSSLDVEIEAGQTYYFKQAIKVGLAKARVKMTRIDESEAQKYFRKCHHVEPTAAGRARASEIAADRVHTANLDVR